MAKNKDEEFVTFLNSAGEVISNDPRYRAKKILEEAGETDDTEELHQELDAARQIALDKDEEIAELRRQLAQANSGVEDEDEEEDDAEEADDYSDLNGKELKARAKEENVSISGMKTVGEVRTALRAAKAARDAQA